MAVIYNSTTNSTPSLCSIPVDSGNQSTRCAVLINSGLHPETGLFKCRLNSQLDHLLEEIMGKIDVRYTGGQEQICNCRLCIARLVTHLCVSDAIRCSIKCLTTLDLRKKLQICSSPFFYLAFFLSLS